MANKWLLRLPRSWESVALADCKQGGVGLGGGGGGLGSVCVDTEAASGNFLPPSASTFCLALQPALLRKWVETQTVEVDFTHSGLSVLGLLLVKSRRLSYVR